MSKKINSIMFKPARQFTIKQRRLDNHWTICKLLGSGVCPTCKELEEAVIMETYTMTGEESE